MRRQHFLKYLVFLFSLLWATSVSATAIEQIACPRMAWRKDISTAYTRNEYQPSPEPIMHCVHRGAHDSLVPGSSGIPENSADAIMLGWKMAPCVEVDAAMLRINEWDSPDLRITLLHDNKVWRSASAFIRDGVIVRNGQLVIQQFAPAGPVRTIRNAEQIPGKSEERNNPQVKDVDVLWLRSYNEVVNYDAQKYDNYPSVELHKVFNYLQMCFDQNGKKYAPGLLVIDVRDPQTLEVLSQLISSMKYSTPDVYKFLVVKTKFWRTAPLVPQGAPTWQRGKDLLVSMADRGVNVTLTLLQSRDDTRDLKTTRGPDNNRITAGQAISEICAAINSKGVRACNYEISAPEGFEDPIWEIGVPVPKKTCIKGPPNPGTQTLWALLNTGGCNTLSSPKFSGWIQAPEFCGIFKAINTIRKDDEIACPSGSAESRWGVNSYSFGQCCAALDRTKREEAVPSYVIRHLGASVITSDVPIGQYIRPEDAAVFSAVQWRFCATGDGNSPCPY